MALQLYINNKHNYVYTGVRKSFPQFRLYHTPLHAPSNRVRTVDRQGINGGMEISVDYQGLVSSKHGHSVPNSGGSPKFIYGPIYIKQRSGGRVTYRQQWVPVPFKIRLYGPCHSNR